MCTSRELRIYCQLDCQRRGNEGDAGDCNLLRISKLLIPKSLRVVQKPAKPMKRAEHPMLWRIAHFSFIRTRTGGTV
jgi:hypothetical protein